MPPALTLTIANVRDGTATIEMLKMAVAAHKDVALNRRYVEGDHWLDGDGWVGPGPSLGDPARAGVLDLVKKIFASRNVIDEILDRVVSAIYGTEPRWYWTPDRPMDPDEDPTTDEDTLITEVNAATTWWWDERRIHAALKRMLYQMLYARRNAARVYIPTGIGGGSTVSASDLKGAMGKIFFDVPDPECGGVWEDPDTKDRVGIVVYKDDENKEHAEVTFLDEAGKTVVRLIPEKTEVANDFSGALPIFEVGIDKPKITEQLRSLNRSLNMTLTLLSKGLTDSHFVERIMLDAMPPGHWEYEEKPDENGNRIRKAYVREPHVTGGRQTTYVQGTDYQDETGKTITKSPSVVFRDPTDPSGTIKGADYWYGMMLDEARQSHVIVNQSSTVGFKSREQARGDFIDSTKDPQTQAEMAGRELLICLVKMAEAISGQAGKFTKKLKPVFKCRPQYGPLTPAERLQNLTEAKDGYMADETAMSLNGIDDTDAELALIQSQPRAQLKLSTDQAAAVKAWVDAGFTFEVGLHMIGLDQKEIDKIIKLNTDTTETPPAQFDANGKPIPPSPNGKPPVPAPAPAVA